MVAKNLFATISSLETGHGVSVHVLAIPEGEAAVRTLHLEPELLVEGDSGVVSVDAQLDTGEVQPVVRQVQRRLHQRRPDALAPSVITHGHPDAAEVTHAPAGGGG